VIKALDQPDTALTPENLVDLTFDLLKHPVEGVRNREMTLHEPGVDDYTVIKR
jgi:hypothetical protein